jgi:hypothetical protein
MMRLIISRTAVFLVAALAVAACGSQRAAPPVTPHVTPSTASQNGPAAFVARAQQVTAQGTDLTPPVPGGPALS